MSILVGVSKMSGISEDSRLSSLIICELVEMFKITLSSIERCARCSADSIASAPPPSKKTKLNKITLSPDSAPARSLAHFLIGLLGLLDASNIFHQKLFDGFMFLLLEKASSRMYFCTFGRHRPRTIDEDAYFPVPNATEPNHHQKEGSEELAIRMELKVLILILQRAMGLAPHHMKQGSKDSLPSSTNHVSRTLSMKTLPSAPRTRLSTLAKDRLQRTFVTCMFGGRQDDEFLDVLTKPVPSMRASTLPNSARIDEEGVEQWYKEEMWRLVGWDIMVREGLR